jgi:hypothetical protein
VQRLAFEAGPKWRHFDMTIEIAAPLKQTAISLVSQIKTESEKSDFVHSVNLADKPCRNDDDGLHANQVCMKITQIRLHGVEIDKNKIEHTELTLVRGNFEIAITDTSRWSLQKLLVKGLALAFQVRQNQLLLEQIEPRPSLDRSDAAYKHFDVTFACNTTTLAKAFGIVSDIEYVRMSGNSTHLRTRFAEAGFKLAHIGFQIPELILPSRVLLQHKTVGHKLSRGDTRLHPFVRQAQALIGNPQFNRKTTEVVTDVSIVSRLVCCHISYLPS